MESGRSKDPNWSARALQLPPRKARPSRSPPMGNTIVVGGPMDQQEHLRRSRDRGDLDLVRTGGSGRNRESSWSTPASRVTRKNYGRGQGGSVSLPRTETRPSSEVTGASPGSGRGAERSGRRDRRSEPRELWRSPRMATPRSWLDTARRRSGLGTRESGRSKHPDWLPLQSGIHGSEVGCPLGRREHSYRGEPGFNNYIGDARVFTRNGGVWSQQGETLAGSNASGEVEQGVSVSISADGSTAFVGSFYDKGSAGAVWVWSRKGTSWSQQGPKLVGSGAQGYVSQGSSGLPSADGTTAIVGGAGDNGFDGAAWIWSKRSGPWKADGQATGLRCRGERQPRIRRGAIG